MLQTTPTVDERQQESSSEASPLDLWIDQLSIVPNLNSINMPSKIVETYSKGSQTEPEYEEEKKVEELVEEHPIHVQPQETSHTTEELVPPVVSLSQDERNNVLQSAVFAQFLSRTSRVIERALDQSHGYDILIDYGKSDDPNDDENNNNRQEQDLVSLDALKMKRRCTFSDARRGSENRAVTSMDISPMYSELVAVSYSSATSRTKYPQDDASSSSASSAGTVLIWSMNAPSSPEYIFVCQTPVLVVKFHPFDKHLILGGTYCGQVRTCDSWMMSLQSSGCPCIIDYAMGHTFEIDAHSFDASIVFPWSYTSYL